MAKAFGFDDSANEMAMFESKADGAMKELEAVAEDMRMSAIDNFARVSRQRTGQGASGIVKETKGKTVTIGWSARPGLHGWFHELGFHALDNRFKKSRYIPRTKRSRKRLYKRVAATYVPPRPHMRPAFEMHEHSIELRVQNKIT